MSATCGGEASSELNHDYLQFLADGVLQASISGEFAWTQRTYNVTAGIHRLTWTYSKDASGTAGSDRGWVDRVVFTSTAYSTWIAT